MAFGGIEGIKCPYQPVEYELYLLPFTGCVPVPLDRLNPQGKAGWLVGWTLS